MWRRTDAAVWLVVEGAGQWYASAQHYRLTRDRFDIWPRWLNASAGEQESTYAKLHCAHLPLRPHCQTNGIVLPATLTYILIHSSCTVYPATACRKCLPYVNDSEYASVFYLWQVQCCVDRVCLSPLEVQVQLHCSFCQPSGRYLITLMVVWKTS